MLEPRGEELVLRYKANYGISDDVIVTETMILQHWTLEKRLRHDLLASTPENRWEVFEKAYDELYSDISWLTELTNSGSEIDDRVSAYHLWERIIGKPPQKVYEIGSGRGELISYLAQHGFECKATEITQERGKKWADESVNMSWGTSDGIHLDRFEPPVTYDVIITNQVVEHMHPDDVLDHMKSSCVILKPGGRYILSTPHYADGPTDITGIFGYDELMAMHLKEYTYAELRRMLLQSGYRRIYSVLRLPRRMRQIIDIPPLVSRVFLYYLIFFEQILAIMPSQTLRRSMARFAKALLFTTTIILVAEK
ncbi:MAG TPA: methyltransferase domain-containing protein [Aggregatilineales bacterium]|nr:methyltransferase domain-containing protein [Aggregatilineales bacterium]